MGVSKEVLELMVVADWVMMGSGPMGHTRGNIGSSHDPPCFILALPLMIGEKAGGGRWLKVEEGGGCGCEWQCQVEEVQEGKRK